MAVKKSKGFSVVKGDPFVTESPVIIHFAHLAEVEPAGKNSSGKFCVTALVDKSDKALIRQLKEQIEEVGQVEDWEELTKHPLVDDNGDLRDGDDKEYDGYAGRIFFKTTSQFPVELYKYDGEGDAVEVRDEDEIKREFYNGAVCTLILKPEMYDDGSVTFYLMGVMKVEDGPKLGGGGENIKGMLLAGMGSGTKQVTEKKKSKPVIEESDDDDEDELPKKKSKKVEVESDDDEDEAPKKEKKSKKSKMSSILGD